MSVYEVALSASDTTIVRFCERTTVQNADTGREIKRYGGGGRFYSVGEDYLHVKLEPYAFLKDFEITLTPPVDVVVEDKQYRAVERIGFTGRRMQLHSRDDALKREAIKRLSQELEQMEAQEAALTRRIADVSENISRLQRTKTEREAQAGELEAEIAQLLASVDTLQHRRDELNSANGEVETLQREIARLDAELDQQRRTVASKSGEASEKRKEHSDQKREIAILESEIKNWKAQIAAEAGKVEALEKERDALQEECKAYGPEVLERLRQRIEELRKQYEASVEEWNTLTGEKRFQENMVEDQSNRNDQVRLEIESLPQELRALQTEYERLTQRLEETIHAQERCSEEQQQMLREQIEQQEPVAHQLQEQYDVLKGQADRLNETIQALQTAKDTEVLQLWPQMTVVMNTLMQNIGEMDAEMDQLEQEVAAFDAQVRSCVERIVSLKEWYHVDQTPLQKLIERIGSLSAIEHERLLQTMDIEGTERVRQLFTTVESSLQELDSIFKSIIKAAQTDEKLAKLKATTNEQHALQEIKKQS